MVRVWVCGRVAVTVEYVDFSDPALADEPDVRERGVRVEVRLADTAAAGSVYVSPSFALAPAVCRVDLLESRPGAADRMHWHPVMVDGEPGDREFERAIPADPEGWLAGRLLATVDLLGRAGVPDPSRFAADAAEVAAVTSEVVDRVRHGLRLAREPWPEVRHDERGLAPVPEAAPA